MIISIADKRIQMLLETGKTKGLPADVVKRLRRKVVQLDAATVLDDLKVPPSNHLEKLSGDRKNQYSIRVNNQWRLCFEWINGEVHGLELVDYH